MKCLAYLEWNNLDDKEILVYLLRTHHCIPSFPAPVCGATQAPNFLLLEAVEVEPARSLTWVIERRTGNHADPPK